MNKYLDTQQLCRNASWYEYGMNYDYEGKFAKKVRTPFFYITLFNRLGAGLYCERYGTSLFFTRGKSITASATRAGERSAGGLVLMIIISARPLAYFSSTRLKSTGLIMNNEYSKSLRISTSEEIL